MMYALDEDFHRLSKKYYEVWFRKEPYYFARANEKTLKMWIKTQPKNIKAFKRIQK